MSSSLGVDSPTMERRFSECWRKVFFCPIYQGMKKINVHVFAYLYTHIITKYSSVDGTIDGWLSSKNPERRFLRCAIKIAFEKFCRKRLRIPKAKKITYHTFCSRMPMQSWKWLTDQTENGITDQTHTSLRPWWPMQNWLKLWILQVEISNQKRVIVESWSNHLI